MFEKNQAQTQDGGGTAIQAGGNVTLIVKNEGVSEATVRDIARGVALEVLHANLMEYRGIAEKTALGRGEEVTLKFLTKLEAENPDGLKQAQNPDFQDALFTVQKEYAKAGDAELGDLLVDLLVDRTKQKERSFVQLVLSESLLTAPKLTQGQIATLSVIFVLRYVSFGGSKTIKMLADNYRSHLSSIARGFSHSDASFRHLEFTGCGTKSMGEIQLEDIWRRSYPGLFKAGFDIARVQAAQLTTTTQAALIVPCLNDGERFQVNSLNESVLDQNLNQLGVSEEEKLRVKALFTEADLSLPDIRRKVLADAPFLEEVANAWPTSLLKNFELNSVGMAIAHANIKRSIGEFAPLSIWIN